MLSITSEMATTSVPVSFALLFTSPVVKRYRVYHASGKIELHDAVKDSWQAYKPAK